MTRYIIHHSLPIVENIIRNTTKTSCKCIEQVWCSYCVQEICDQILNFLQLENTKWNLSKYLWHLQIGVLDKVLSFINAKSDVWKYTQIKGYILYCYLMKHFISNPKCWSVEPQNVWIASLSKYIWRGAVPAHSFICMMMGKQGHSRVGFLHGTHPTHQNRIPTQRGT